jgi:hypothetical protein
VRNKNGLHLFHGEVEPLHALFRFAAGNTRINQNSLMVVGNVIAVAITSGIQGGYK